MQLAGVSPCVEIKVMCESYTWNDLKKKAIEEGDSDVSHLPWCLTAISPVNKDPWQKHPNILCF